MDADFLIEFISLFFVPALPVYLHHKKAGRPIVPSLELLFQYGISAAVLIPAADILLLLLSKYLPFPIPSGFGRLLAALLLFLLPEMSFLLRRAPDGLWPFWTRFLYEACRVALLLAAACWLGRALLSLAGGTDPELAALLPSSGQTLLFFLNILPVVLLIFFFYGAAGRAWIGFLAGGGISLALSLANYYKLVFRNDPLYFSDLLLLREAADMTAGDRFPLFMDQTVSRMLLGFFLCAFLLFLLASGKRGKRQRCVFLAGSLLAAALLIPHYLSEPLYDSVVYHMSWVPTQDYVLRGFFYPFLHSASDSVSLPPDGYRKADVESLLSDYEDSGIPPERRVNIIAIMREAYADFSRYDIEGLDTGGYDLYHALEAESYTGSLVTNIFAGGTVNTERCFLTGNYGLPSIRGDCNSYVWYLRSQGYTAEGSHTFHRWYYNRQNVNRSLGFENYRFLDGFPDITYAKYPEDRDLYAGIYEDFIKNKSTGKPYFSFSVTMQSHGSYSDGDAGNPMYLSDGFPQECRYCISNYLSTVWQCDAALAELIDQLRTDPEPVVLVTFGDHLPELGDNAQYYREMGINLDQATNDGFYIYYSTRYLIWANDAAKELLGHDMKGEGPPVSPCFLMNVVFQQLGWKGPAFMQAMEDYRAVFPIASTNGRYLVDGVLVSEIPDERKKTFQDFLSLQYYWQRQFLYGG